MSENQQQAQPKKPTTYSELYPGRFLHADHLRGEPHTLTIADVNLESLHGEKGDEVKAILAFRETPLLLVLPKINGLCLREMFGVDVRAWTGKRVTLYPTADYAPLKRGEACVRVLGSPDIREEVAVEIRMPKRKAFTMRMQVTKPKAGAAKPPAAPPPPSDDYNGRMP